MLLTSLLALITLVSATSPAAVDKRKPACCGCDIDQAKPRVRTLTNNFFTFLRNGDLWRAETQLAPGFQLARTVGCNDRTCCALFGSLLDVAPLLASAPFEIAESKYELHRDGSVTATLDIVVYSGEVTYVFRTVVQWIQTPSCNYQITSITMTDLRCLEGIPLDGLCNLTCSVSDNYPTFTSTNTSTTITSTTSFTTSSTTSTSTTLTTTTSSSTASTTSTSISLTTTTSTSVSTSTTLTTTITTTTTAA